MKKLLPVALLAGAMAAGCSGDDPNGADGVSYTADVRPILDDRCVICHYPGFSRDLVNPFNPENGLFESQNRSFLSGHDAFEFNVVPGDPDSSALIKKISDRELVPGFCDVLAMRDDECPIERHGLFMPPITPPATAEQVERVRLWIEEGAEDTEFFRTSVMTFFGDGNFRGDFCGRGGYQRMCIMCDSCHYEGTATPPDLSRPFESLINVPALYRPDLMLVVPGDPDASFLVMKLEARAFSTAFGSPMPYAVEALSDAQVDTLRQWVLEGARPD